MTKLLEGKNNRIIIDGKNYIVIDMTVDNEDVTVGDEDDHIDSYDQDSMEDTDDQPMKCKGQQSIKSYFRVRKGQTTTKMMTHVQTKTKLRTSGVVTSDEGRKKMIMVGNDVEALFPSMTDKNTGTAVCNQVIKSPLVIKGADYMEMARYCAGNRHLCGDLSEVENILPWRRTTGKGGVAPGMQSIEMKGKTKGLDKVRRFPAAKPTPYQERILLSKMAEIGNMVLWTNFVYKFGGEYFLPMEGALLEQELLWQGAG